MRRSSLNAIRLSLGGGLAICLAIFGLGVKPVWAAGASLKLSPAAGTYEVGSLVDVAIMVDTGGEAVNAVEATLQFPADKMQVVNPAASTSFISMWVTAPMYSNTDGTVTFQGGLPTPGIKTSAGVISTVTFRIKAAGAALLKFGPSARVLRNDGQGTNILTVTGTASLTLKVPPPAGPLVSSPTHGDQNSWYNNAQIQFVWDAVDQAVGYSYVLDQSPKTIPAEVVTGKTTAASLKATGDGIWYFHLRAQTDAWGGVTTFPVQIDTTAPASFVPKVDRRVATVEDSGIVSFTTTDAASGIDHYEVKVVAKNQAAGENTLFVETTSPYSYAKLSAGDYTFIVRAVDRAGNSTEGSVPLQVVNSGVPFLARVPLLRNPAVANTTLAVLAVLTAGLLTMLLLRRVRLRSTFRHDLAMLERDAEKKSAALQRELDELRAAQAFTQPSSQPNPSTPVPTSTIRPSNT